MDECFDLCWPFLLALPDKDFQDSHVLSWRVLIIWLPWEMEGCSRIWQGAVMCWDFPSSFRQQWTFSDKLPPTQEQCWERQGMLRSLHSAGGTCAALIRGVPENLQKFILSSTKSCAFFIPLSPRVSKMCPHLAWRGFEGGISRCQELFPKCPHFASIQTCCCYC